MQNKQIWELNISTAGDPIKNMLMLNGELITAAEACVIVGCGDKPTFLDIKIPIYDGNLIIKTDATKPVDREVIVATTEKE